MADALLSLGVEKLWDLLVREAYRFKEVDKQFNQLKRDVSFLRLFLKDADAKKHSSEVVKGCVDEIKEIVLDAEDIIETFVLEEEQTSCIIQYCMRILSCFIVGHSKLAPEIEGISERISEVIRTMETYGVQQITVHGGECSHPLQERQREMRRTYASNNESNLVGLEDNVKKLVSYLVEEDNNHVVSIIGMGGIGKTTLARQVFNHEMIKTHFDGVVWVCISQQFTTTYVWQTILKKLSSKHDEKKVSKMTQDELQEELHKLLETSKSLIILDDMWKEEDWDRLEPVFPSKKGWKILLTSRYEKVGIHVDPTCVTLKPECLTIEDSWTLLKRIIFPRKDTSEYKVDVEMEDMGKKMVKHCGGLPLAVKVLGGLLAGKHSLSEWERIHENIGSHIDSVYNILNLSFEEMPTYLKHCFLYLAHFPENYSIDVDKLSYYLEADGIQKPKYYNGLTIPEVADRYIEELVERNMVISLKDELTSRFKICQLHDMMRGVCLRKAEEEKFVHVLDPANSVSPCKSPRISVHKVNDTFHVEGLMKNPKLRSLLFIEDSSLLLPSALLFTRLQLLRALDLSRVRFKGGKLHSSIGKLIHLRYLNLYEAKVSHLPSSMRNLRLLLYLNICVSSVSPIFMSNTLLNEMRELEYLHLPWRNVHNKVKMELGNLVKLETLINFSTNHCSVKDLHRMTRLKTLEIRLYKEDRCGKETLSSSLSEVKHLESLTIYDEKKNDEKGFVLDCVRLKQLHLHIYMPRFPDEQRFPSHLTTITLERCRLEEDPMVILEKLLQLKEVRLWYNAFCGRRMVCSRGGFPQLQKLQLVSLNKLEEWIVEEGSMPLLHSLIIESCLKLMELPEGMRFIFSLKTLEIRDAPLGWEEKLSRGGEDYYKVQHIPLVQFKRFMADTFGVEKLWDLLVRESDRFKEVDEQFNELKTKLTLLRPFLKDADAKKDTSAVVKSCVDEIKEIVFDAEDVIETFLRKEEVSKTSGTKKHMRRLSFFIVDRRGLASEIRGISYRISKVIRHMQSFGVVEQKMVYGGECLHPLQERQREMRMAYDRNNESDLVGLEDNVKKLVGYLVEEDNNHVVSIIGMGGIGKTTLARQVFNHEMIKTHFDGVVWVCISQQFTKKYVWQTMLKKLSSKHDENRVSNMTEDDLQEALFQLLESSKSLIILDDMWKEGDWDILKHAFPSKKGWKIIVTSRNERVGLHVDPTCLTFKPELLTMEDSWTLFKRIAFPSKYTSEYKVNVEMEEMGKKMIKHCEGLPLVVKVLGGLLAGKHSLNEWERISKNIGSQILRWTSITKINIFQGLPAHILNLSFEELPAHLKHCFLYLAHFPEDYSIDVEELSYYLEADEIQKSKYYDGLTIPEVAEGYIEELVKRNMVISARDELTSRFEKCQLHDMMREVCLRKAKEEKFVHVVDHANSMSPCISRRIAVHGIGDTYHPEALMKNPKLRSVLFIKDSSMWASALFSLPLPSALLFTRLQLLRALDLSYMKFEGGKLHSSIGNLIHLRYLSLFQAEVSHLPSSLRNLKLLLYLNIDVYSMSPIYMSNTLLNEMRELEYLHLPPGNVHNKVKIELSNLVKLVTLINFAAKYCTMRDLHRMIRLKKLVIRIYKGDVFSMETLSSSLSEVKHLESLTIYDEKNDEEGFVLDCVHLKQLYLMIYMPRLPDEQRFPSNLTTITLERCRLEEDPMVILEKLLQLKKVCLWDNAFCGRRMVCSRGGFPQLQELELYADEFEEWIVEEGSMPLLHSLSICDCPKLKEIPDGMRFISSLKTLEIWDAPLGWKEKLSRGGEDFYKVQHIPLVQFKFRK